MTTKMKFHTRFNYHKEEPKTYGESKTKQSFRDEVNINSIVKKYFKTKDRSLLEAKEIFYADFSQDVDLASAYLAIDKAESNFMELSAETRAYFDNDPVKFFETFRDPDKIKNLPEELGLVKPKPLASETESGGMSEPVAHEAPAETQPEVNTSG